MRKKRYRFRIPIGDWANDGHNQCEDFEATALKPIEAVREAYFKGCENSQLAEADALPEQVCNNDESYSIEAEKRAVIREVTGIDMLEGLVEADQLADYVLWVINHGDPELEARRVASSPRLQFYDRNNGRRIDGFGYGLFELE